MDVDTHIGDMRIAALATHRAPVGELAPGLDDLPQASPSRAGNLPRYALALGLVVSGLTGGFAMNQLHDAPQPGDADYSSQDGPEGCATCVLPPLAGLAAGYLALPKDVRKRLWETDAESNYVPTQHTILGRGILKLPDMLAGAADDFTARSARYHPVINKAVSRYTAYRFRGSDHLEVAGQNLLRRAPAAFVDPNSGVLTTPHLVIQKARDEVAATPDLSIDEKGPSKGGVYNLKTIGLATAARRELLKR